MTLEEPIYRVFLVLPILHLRSGYLLTEKFLWIKGCLFHHKNKEKFSSNGIYFYKSNQNLH